MLWTAVFTHWTPRTVIMSWAGDSSSPHASNPRYPDAPSIWPISARICPCRTAGSATAPMAPPESSCAKAATYTASYAEYEPGEGHSPAMASALAPSTAAQRAGMCPVHGSRVPHLAGKRRSGTVGQPVRVHTKPLRYAQDEIRRCRLQYGRRIGGIRQQYSQLDAGVVQQMLGHHVGQSQCHLSRGLIWAVLHSGVDGRAGLRSYLVQYGAAGSVIRIHGNDPVYSPLPHQRQYSRQDVGVVRHEGKRARVHQRRLVPVWGAAGHHQHLAAGCPLCPQYPSWPPPPRLYPPRPAPTGTPACRRLPAPLCPRPGTGPPHTVRRSAARWPTGPWPPCRHYRAAPPPPTRITIRASSSCGPLGTSAEVTAPSARPTLTDSAPCNAARVSSPKIKHDAV